MTPVHADSRRARPADVSVLPCRGQEMVFARPRDGIGVDRVEFVADLSPAFVFEPYLPEKICAETRQFAAAFDVGFDRQTHLARPVFVMANDRQARIGVEQRRAIMQVGLRDEVELVARLLRPDHEVPIELRPARGRVVLAEPVRIGPFQLRIARSVAEFRKRIRADARRAGRQPDDAARPWPLQGEHRRGEVRAPARPRRNSDWRRRNRCRTVHVLVGRITRIFALPRLLRRPHDEEMMLHELAEVLRARKSRRPGRTPSGGLSAGASDARPATRSRCDRRLAALACGRPQSPRPCEPSRDGSRRDRSRASSVGAVVDVWKTTSSPGSYDMASV